MFPDGILALDYFGDLDLHGLRSRRPIQVLALERDLGRPRTLLSLGRAALGLAWDSVVYAGGIENRPHILERLAGRGRILGNDAAAVRRVRDPRRLFSFLSRHQIPHAPTLVKARRAPPSWGGRYLWKAARSGAGGKVRRAAAGEGRPRGYYLQEFVRGPVLSASVVASEAGATVLGVSRQIVGSPVLGSRGFRYAGNIIGPSRHLLSGRAFGRLQSMTSAICERFHLSGLNGIDFVLANDMPCLIEVNPRYTASMELLEDRSGQNLVDIHLTAALGGGVPAGPLDPSANAPRYLAKGILYAERRVWSGDPEELVALGCRDVPHAGERFEVGQPICTIVTGGSSAEGCERSLAGRAAIVRRTLRTRRPVRAPNLSAHMGTW
jgi:predicted ATP-grasp superfamily ATP-dependent carboligase